MQQILNGIHNLYQIMEQVHFRKPMLVTDASFPFLSIKTQIEGITLPKALFNNFTPNPLQEQVDQGAEQFLKEDCDALIAVGGGSCIDVAKCIKLTCLEHRDAIPLIAIPTTAGTGSESTHNAVVYLNGVKQTVTDDRILPDVAILEPSVLKTLPLYQKKCTMMDALCQGIESWWSLNSTDESKGYSKTAVGTIMTHWERYIFDNDEDAAEKIMSAANFSGKAINLAQTTAAHAMSYKITSLYKLPHGHAVAVCLPEIWDYMLKHPEHCIDPRGYDYVTRVFHQIAGSMGKGQPTEAIQQFRKMMSMMGLEKPHSTSERDSELELLSQSVNPVRLKNNPIQLEKDAILELYRTIVEIS